MNLKKKLGTGIATAVLGIGLIGGGVFAYFSDTAAQTNTFASGTIELDVDPTVQVPMENLKPGDWMPRSFELQNNGSLDMAYVNLTTEYTVRDGQGHVVSDDLADAYAEQLYVRFLNNTTGDRDHQIVFEASLKDLRDLTPEDLATKIDVETIELFPGVWIPLPWGGGFWLVDPINKEIAEEVTGIATGETAEFDVEFYFNETGEAQNDLQGLNLDLTWTFEGFQTDGEER